MSARNLRSRYRVGAELLLACRRFSPDMLLIAAEAFDEFAREARFDKQTAAADEAQDLADRLRDEAPRRTRSAFAAPATPASVGLHHAQAPFCPAGEPVQRSMHVGGGLS